MGHAADLALGIALAQPQRTVVCLNGDGSMLMSLGTLAVAARTKAVNLVLFVVDNGTFEITGHQPHAGTGRVDFAAMAKAAGFPLVFKFDDAKAYAEAVPDLLNAPGPTFVHVLVEPGDEGPISRSSSEPSRYLQSSLAGWSRMMRTALGSD
jgi:phosphonopyruvate decarboxylase